MRTLRTQALSPLLPMICVTALCAACDSEDAYSSISAENIAAPEDTDSCIFSSDVDGLFRSSTSLNTSPPPSDPTPVVQTSLRLRARVTNGMTSVPTAIDTDQEYSPGTRVKAVNFTFNWECDPGELAFGVGPIFVPGVALTTPFCDDPRSDGETFAGRYTVAANGDNIDPQETGLVVFEPVSTSLGLAFDNSFAIAEAANLCCIAEGGCDNVADAEIATGDGRCRQLQILFNQISDDGSLNANVEEDVSRWQPFSIYTFPTLTANQEGLVRSPATYPLRIRGRFEFVNQGGDIISSDELLHSIRICRNCSRSTSSCTL